jgi:hypothetical protein
MKIHPKTDIALVFIIAAVSVAAFYGFTRATLEIPFRYFNIGGKKA